MIPASIPFVVTDLTASKILSASGALYQADRALRNNRHYQRMMLHDPDILQAVQIRAYTATLLPWTVEPEDPDDPQQAAECAAITKAIERIRGLTNMIKCLNMAPWYGATGVWLKYERLPKAILGTAQLDQDDPESGNAEAAIHTAPVSFTPLHPDSLLWGHGGELALKVNQWREGDMKPAMRITVEGPAAYLDDAMRASVVCHVWNREGPEYDDVTTAARVFGGRGLRDHCWFAWSDKMQLRQAASHYAERYARGTTIILHHPSDEGKTAAEEIARSMVEAFTTLVPVTTDLPGGEMVKIVEPSGTGHQIFTDLLDRAAASLNKVILHQELTTGTAPTGLGSNVAEVHEATFRDVVDFDARGLGDTLTHDLVSPLQRLNFPDQDAHYRLRFAITDDNEELKRRIDMADALVRMGVTLSERDLRRRADFPEPRPDEATVGGDDGTASLFGLEPNAGM